MLSRLFAAHFRRPSTMTGRALKVYVDLVDHLFNDIGSVAGGVIGIMTLAFVSYQYDHDNFFLEIMGLVGLVGVSRLTSISYYRRKLSGRPKGFRTARRWELSYAL
ncbi:MAG: hypothetical protein ACRCTI_10430, partial [Beijerinckiaceae bacterium]